MHGYPATTREGLEPEEEQQPRLNRQEPYEEALRAVCQRALDTAKALQGDIGRLSQRTRGGSQTHSQTHSRSQSCSLLEAEVGVTVGLAARVIPRNGSQSRQPWFPDGSLPGSRVTFREPVVELNSEGNVEDHMAKASVSNLETWLEWQAKQLGTPAWWPELKDILRVKDL